MPTIDVKIPASGESITSANVAQWHKQNGALVKKGDLLVTLETDKVSNELEADASGILEILTPEGEEVAIHSVIARITTSSEASLAEPATEAPVAKPALEELPNKKGTLIEVKVPISGESITSANVAKWHKKHGDQVQAGEVIVTLETDKISNELEALASGKLEIITPEGGEVPIHTTIAVISTSDSTPAEIPAYTPVAPIAATSSTELKPVPATTAATTSTAPIMSKNTTTMVPDASLLKSSPPVNNAIISQSEGRITRKKMSMLRRKIASHLVNAQQTAAILSTFNEVDMTAIMELRKSVQDDFTKKHGVKLGFMSFFVKAVTQALKAVPSINASIDGSDVIQNHFYDVGVAVGTDKGLVVPVIRDCDQKSFAQIEQDILDFAQKAREGKITLEDLQGGVFTISNGGVYGSLLSTPILSPPQSGILGMHTIQQRPIALNGQVVIRPMMYLALSYDHRLVDGKEAVTFLLHIKNSLESPTRLLLEM